MLQGMIKALAAGGVALVLWAASAFAAEKVTERFSVRAEASAVRVDHGAWDALLKARVTASADGVNRVDYAAFTATDKASLEAYLTALQAVDVDGLSASEQYAYWVNLYNALTVKVILDHYPVDSIRKIKYGRLIALGPWGEPLVTVKGERLTLDNIEHDILRPIFKDPRTHYAVNCASLGCPNLQLDALTSQNLEALLDAGARAYVNHPRGIKVEGGKVRASSIYTWFQKDFGGSEAGVLAHVRQYANDELEAALQGKTDISSYDYDWSLNDTKNTKDARL